MRKTSRVSNMIINRHSSDEYVRTVGTEQLANEPRQTNAVPGNKNTAGPFPPRSLKSSGWRLPRETKTLKFLNKCYIYITKYIYI